MVVKKMRNKKLKKSKIAHAIDIINYVTDGDRLTASNKVYYKNYGNINAKNYEEMLDEIISTSYKTKSKNPLLHFMVSFKKGEHPSNRQVDEIIEMMLAETGFKNCQYVYALHSDTQHFHIHCVVNRYDLKTGKVINPFGDVRLFHNAAVKIEKKQGWKPENGRNKPMDKKQIQLPDRAVQIEIRQAEESVYRIAVKVVLPILEISCSWQEVHQKLAALGFSYEKKGAGALLTCLYADGQTVFIKPSKLARWASLANMQNKLGNYQTAEVFPTPRQRQAIDSSFADAFNRYQEFKRQRGVEKSRIREEFEKEKIRLNNERKVFIAALKKNGLVNDSDIFASEYHKRMAVSLAARFREKIITGKMVSSNVGDFESWLAMTGVPSDDFKEVRFKGSTFTAIAGNQLELFREYHSVMGAERYRVTIINSINGKSQIKEYSPEEIEKNIDYLQQQADRKENIYYTPLSRRCHYIVVDDVSREHCSKMIDAGFTPSVIVESSPDNFQLIVKVPKFKKDDERTRQLNRRIGNVIARDLNRIYGDVNFSGAVHPHRAPGFYNFKDKYKSQDGLYPNIKLEVLAHSFPQRLIEFSIFYKKYLDHNVPGFIAPTAIYNENAYANHKVDIESLFGKADDYSRLDYMIATRLRVSGYSQEEIAQTLETNAPLHNGKDIKIGLPMPNAPLKRFSPYRLTKKFKNIKTSTKNGRKLLKTSGKNNPYYTERN